MKHIFAVLEAIMIRKIISAVIAIASLTVLVGAQVNFDNGGGISYFTAVQDHTYVAVPKPNPALLASIKEPAEWTIMVYINGKNNLEEFALKDINEMEMVGSTDKINIVVELGRMDGYDASDGDWKGVRRYLVKKDSDSSKINSLLVEDLGMKDMGDYNSLISFGKWAKEKFPAKRYMLVVWNHGSGWTKGGKPIITKGISYDEQSGNHINTPQLGLALKEIGKVDVYGSDACLMQMAEVDYEIKDYAT